MIDFRRPNINAPTIDGQIVQVKNYLYQLSNELNLALKAAESEESKYAYSSLLSAQSDTEKNPDADNAKSTFASIKNLIIKSADIVNAYYDVIEEKLSGSYVAQSDFGTYKEKTDTLIVKTSENETKYYNSVEEIYDAMGNLSELRKDGFYMRTGWLYEDETVGGKIGGIELGQVSGDGTETDTSFARFTTKALNFYGEDGKTLLGSFSQYKLKIMELKVEGNVELRGYKIDTSDGISFDWVGED